MNGVSLGGQTNAPFSKFGVTQNVAGLGSDIELLVRLFITHLAAAPGNITTTGDFQLGVASAEVPVPPALPLLAASLAGFALLGRRRKLA